MSKTTTLDKILEQAHIGGASGIYDGNLDNSEGACADCGGTK